MNDAKVLAQHYFDLSNQRRLTEIERLFTAHSTYSSANAGVLLGAESIMAMQRDFFAKFDSLAWTIHDVQMPAPGVVMFDFTFAGELTSGGQVQKDGLEYVVVHGGKIVHVDVRDKS